MVWVLVVGVASICGCSGIRSRAAQFSLNAGTEAALTELLRDHMLNYSSSHSQVTLALLPNWPGVPPREMSGR